MQLKKRHKTLTGMESSLLLIADLKHKCRTRVQALCRGGLNEHNGHQEHPDSEHHSNNSPA